MSIIKWGSLALSLIVAGCASTGGAANFSPNFIVDQGGAGRMSNTNAVAACEKQNGPASCTQLRYEELDRLYAYLEDTYEDTPTRNLAMGMLISEQIDVLQARAAGRGYSSGSTASLGDIPLTRSERLAQQARQQQAANQVLSTIGQIGSAMAGASGAGGGSSGTSGPDCVPSEVKNTTRPYCD